MDSSIILSILCLGWILGLLFGALPMCLAIAFCGLEEPGKPAPSERLMLLVLAGVFLATGVYATRQAVAVFLEGEAAMASMIGLGLSNILIGFAVDLETQRLAKEKEEA